MNSSGNATSKTKTPTAAGEWVKKIVILEARGLVGGNAKFVKGIFAAESRLQKGLGIDASRGGLFRKAMDYTNPRLVRALVGKSGDTIAWLEEKGMQFDWIPPLYPGQDPLVFHFHKTPEETGPKFVQAFEQRCADSGINIFLKTRAQSLLTDNKGKIAGILAENKDKERKITAKTVIIATVGFAGNQALLKRYLPSYVENEIHRAGIPHNGDGIRMAEKIGAATEGLDVLEMNGPAAFPLSSALSPVVKHPKTVWMNKKGMRFTDEALPLFPESANRLYHQPGRISYTIFIGNAFSAMFKQKRLTLTEAEKGLSIFKGIPIRYIDPDFVKALKLSKQANIYAYDAYFLDCAIRYKAPLLTLDRKLIASALNFNVETLEV